MLTIRHLSLSLLYLYIVSVSLPLQAQNGPVLYTKWCAVCHENTTQSQAPGRDVLAKMTAEQVITALEKGPMKAQALDDMISRAERVALAEYLSGKTLGSTPANPTPKSAFCGASNSFPNSLSGPAWNGWGVTMTNARFQPLAAAGMTANDVPRLKLKWAFGFPDATSASSQPVVVGDRVYVGSWEGDFYSLDAKTGCIEWTFAAESGVRSAASIGKGRDGRLAVYFGDLAANVYALDAATGKQLWKAKADDYPASRVTGSPTLYNGRLYIPISSREESRVEAENFTCCKFRGSVVAINAADGKQIWKTYTIAEAAQPTQKNRAGTQLYGPSGVPVWDSPTIDAKRNVLYVGTGNNYSTPFSPMSDSIIAMDLKSGKIRWVRQFQENDVWNRNCGAKDRDPAFCPDKEAPDVDFSTSPVLVQLKNGRQILAIQGKSAVIYALDPDGQGKTVWQLRIGKGGAGAAWGPALDGQTLYASADPTGLVAIDLSSGQQLWSVPSPPCKEEEKGCSPVQNAALTAIPGVVFAESMGGHIRAYSTKDGKILWDESSAAEYKSVNGVTSNGGSISNGGATVVGGMLFINSGYSHHGAKIPGNVLLAFSAEGTS